MTDRKTWYALAKELGVSTQTILYHRRKPESPSTTDREEWERYLAIHSRATGLTPEAKAEMSVLKHRLLAAQTQREERKDQVEAGKLVAKDEVERQVAEALAAMFSELDRHFCSELPSRAKGKDELGIRAISKEVIAGVKAVIRSKFVALAATGFVFACVVKHLPGDGIKSICDWAESNVALPISAMSKTFDPDITPWIREPLEQLLNDETRMLTFIKPVQSGGSTVGEIALCYWLSQASGGDVQYNWQNDEQADDRYVKRIERILRACPSVMKRWPMDRFRAMKGLVIFPHCNFITQGVYTARNVASDSIKYQINEEVHDEDGWLPGRLEQAWGRTTAFWDHVIVNISNAGRKGSELHRCFEAGTQQHWQVKCPGCGQYHSMRTKWEDKHPELGGLRYDSEACKNEDGAYDYNKLIATVRYQMPCGFTVPDDTATRRALSLSGRYSEPQNPGARTSHRSYTLQAVSVDYISWISLIQQKHSALKALKYGDPEPWRKYLRERECVFAGEEDRPFVGRLVLSEVKKDRAGLVGRAFRFAGVDRQQGHAGKGEAPHWWLVIRDVMQNGDSMLVWESKEHTDEDLVEVLKRHEVNPRDVVVDSGWDTSHVYDFCLRNGYNAIKGADAATFSHGDGVRKIYSKSEFLWPMQRKSPSRANPMEEPQFWLYSKTGIRDRLHWLRGGKACKWEVPKDVSEDYQAHMESEELQIERDRFGVEKGHWVQLRERNDLFVCECYIAMQMDEAGLIGANT